MHKNIGIQSETRRSVSFFPNKPGLLLRLDFEKAFDFVDSKFMHRVLQAGSWENVYLGLLHILNVKESSLDSVPLDTRNGIDLLHFLQLHAISLTFTCRSLPI